MIQKKFHKELGIILKQLNNTLIHIICDKKIKTKDKAIYKKASKLNTKLRCVLDDIECREHDTINCYYSKALVSEPALKNRGFDIGYKTELKIFQWTETTIRDFKNLEDLISNLESNQKIKHIKFNITPDGIRFWYTVIIIIETQKER